MNGLLVSELASRSGLRATTLRFYEQEGLLPAARSKSGYRVYDDAAVDRLRFIVTAKRLGLTLPEIRELLQPWEHGGCRDVQDELGPLIEARISDARMQIAALQAFSATLEAAREHLARTDRDGPCDRSCTFLQDPVPRSLLEELPQPNEAAAAEQTPAVACSLAASERVDRAERWREVLAPVTARRRIDGGLRLEFDPGQVDIAELARVAAAEADCCGFLDLRLMFGPVPVLEVRAPGDAFDVVVELFGMPQSS